MLIQPDRIQEYLKRLTPLARGNLLIELERLEVCGSEIPGSANSDAVSGGAAYCKKLVGQC